MVFFILYCNPPPILFYLDRFPLMRNFPLTNQLFGALQFNLPNPIRHQSRRIWNQGSQASASIYTGNLSGKSRISLCQFFLARCLQLKAGQLGTLKPDPESCRVKFTARSRRLEQWVFYFPPSYSLCLFPPIVLDVNHVTHRETTTAPPKNNPPQQQGHRLTLRDAWELCIMQTPFFRRTSASIPLGHD